MTYKRLTLNDFHFGNTDAKNELLTYSPQEIRRFTDSFVTPPSLSVPKFLTKEKYYVVGLKGTGKTALLRYISISLEERENSICKFVLFKSQIDEDTRKGFANAVRVQLVEENSQSFEGNDFETIWRWLIYKKIAQTIREDNVKTFQNNNTLSQFLSLVETKTDDENNGFSKLIPKIRRGQVKISRTPHLQLDLEWDHEEKAKIKFNDLVRKADHFFEQLEPDTQRLNIFFDELELNYETKKKFQRDTQLVRDLIVSVEKINALAKSKGIELCLYAAIRSEVLTSIHSLGKEINKPIGDFGATILWNRPGLSAAQQPLLSIIEKRINAARVENELPPLSSQEVWEQYFPEEIHGKTPEIYILHNTWYRPRDIVRLLISIQDQYPDNTEFDIQSLETVRKTYSTSSWVELTEELKTKYQSQEIDGIKYIFYGFRQILTFSEIETRSKKAADDYTDVYELLKKHKLKDVLKDLFRIGVIGNINTNRNRMRFSFRGDDEILFNLNIFVHNALKAHLSIFD
ncbi:P-loop ATPase, Sll1717 family [Desulfobaculum sp. SPO524]|uniref:P-loop ATPase, Sll1717 family n=1 Tax=Desulfobaculum sp. SPO524 TaxID=3378071 RepID=UPI003853E479